MATPNVKPPAQRTGVVENAIQTGAGIWPLTVYFLKLGTIGFGGPGARAITDLPTAIIGLVSLVILWCYKLSEPIIVTASGVIGLLLWPLLRLG